MKLGAAIALTAVLAVTSGVLPILLVLARSLKRLRHLVVVLG